MKEMKKERKTLLSRNNRKSVNLLWKEQIRCGVTSCEKLMFIDFSGKVVMRIYALWLVED